MEEGGGDRGGEGEGDREREKRREGGRREGEKEEVKLGRSLREGVIPQTHPHLSHLK